MKYWNFSCEEIIDKKNEIQKFFKRNNKERQAKVNDKN